MQKVLHIGLSYERGGIEGFVMNYYRSIDKSIIQFDFINPYNKPLAYEKEILSMGGIVYRLPDFHKKPILFRKELKSIIKTYEVVHIHMLSAANLIPLQVAAECNVRKIIAHSHNTLAEGIIRQVLHRIHYKKIKKYANILLACSEKAGEWMFGKDVSFEVMKNAINIDKYAYNQQCREDCRRELNINDNSLLYGNVGRLNVQKNQLFLIDIFAEILKKQPNSYLCIIGDGELKQDIINKANKLGISNRVLMTGSRADIHRLYSALDVIIMPSIFEGLPITLVEAQANGLKCYVSKNKVPDESKIIDSMEFLDLSLGAKKWAEKIVVGEYCRDGSAEDVLITLHYDISRESSHLESVYLG